MHRRFQARRAKSLQAAPGELAVTRNRPRKGLAPACANGFSGTASWQAFARCMKRHLSPEDEDDEAFREELYEKLPQEQAQNLLNDIRGLVVDAAGEIVGALHASHIVHVLFGGHANQVDDTAS